MERGTREHVHTLANDLQLSHMCYVKLHLSLPELELLYGMCLVITTVSDRQSQVVHLSLWTTGVPPSSVFGIDHLRGQDRAQAVLQWQNLCFFSTRDGPAAENNFHILKRPIDPHQARRGKRLTLLLMPVCKRELFLADPAVRFFILPMNKVSFAWPMDTLLSSICTDIAPRLVPNESRREPKPCL